VISGPSSFERSENEVGFRCRDSGNLLRDLSLSGQNVGIYGRITTFWAVLRKALYPRYLCVCTEV